VLPVSLLAFLPASYGLWITAMNRHNTGLPLRQTLIRAVLGSIAGRVQRALVPKQCDVVFDFISRWSHEGSAGCSGWGKAGFLCARLAIGIGVTGFFCWSAIHRFGEGEESFAD